MVYALFLMEECSPSLTQNATETVMNAYGQWQGSHSISLTICLTYSARSMRPRSLHFISWTHSRKCLIASIQIWHEAIKNIYDVCMKESQSVKEHVLDVMVHFNMAEINGLVNEEQSQLSLILESLLKSFLQFCTIQLWIR